MMVRDKKPNIIYIMADDMGYGDVGCYNTESKIPTPNMDKLASQGVIFTDAHSVSSVCTPSRYGVLTGRYCWRTDLKNNVLYGYEPPLINEKQLTVATLLKQEGYSTACVGKWHLGLNYSLKEGEVFDFTKPLPWSDAAQGEEELIDFSAGVTGGPTKLGFDYFFGTSGCSTCQPPYGFIEGETFPILPSEYITEAPFTGRPGMSVPLWKHVEADTTFTEKAVNWIKLKKDEEQPFFLYLAASAPHEPCVEAVVPEFARGQSSAGPRGDLVWLFDWMVGQILDVLDETGQAGNTLVIVTSDNGALPGDQVFGATEANYNTWNHKSCGDFRGYKAHIWEGGHREPFIIRWPEVVERGVTCSHLVGLNDFMATCADLLGVDLVENEAEDSVSFVPLLLHQDKAKPVRTDLIHHSCFGVFSVRKGPWKLIVDCDNSGGWPPPCGTGPTAGTAGQLYNINNDPREQINLWSEKPEIVKDLMEILEKTQH
jgi:arylsulfatase A